jgi:hypothetical protein
MLFRNLRFIAVYTRARISSVFSQINPVHTLKHYASKSFLYLSLTSSFFLSGFPVKILCIYLIYLMRIIFPSHHTLLDLVTLMTFAKA